MSRDDIFVINTHSKNSAVIVKIIFSLYKFHFLFTSFFRARHRCIAGQMIPRASVSCSLSVHKIFFLLFCLLRRPWGSPSFYFVYGSTQVGQNVLRYERKVKDGGCPPSIICVLEGLFLYFIGEPGMSSELIADSLEFD